MREGAGGGRRARWAWSIGRRVAVAALLASACGSPDEGVDAGAIPDASARDAAPDAGAIPDASARDAAPDGAPPDAALPDGAPPDAAPPDAAPPDAAPPDAAPPDAALPDAAPPACQALANGGFETGPGPGPAPPEGWSLDVPGDPTVVPDDGTFAVDEAVFAEGARSLRVHPEPGHLFLVYQTFYLYERSGATSIDLDVSASMRHEGLHGATPVALLVSAVRASDGGALGSLALTADPDAGVWKRYAGTLSVPDTDVVLHVVAGAVGDPADDAGALGWLDDLAIEPRPCVAPRACPLVEASTPVSREAAIPSGAPKITPAEDPAPPVVHAAFASEFFDPEPVDGPINTAGAEDSVFIPADDDGIVYFYFTPTMLLPMGEQVLMPEEGIWSVRRTWVGSSWSWGTPEKVWLFDTVAGEGCEFVRGDTIGLCAAACGYDGLQLFGSSFVAGAWTIAEPLAAPFDDPAFAIGEYHVTVDENGVEWIYYHSARPGGHGERDLWVTGNGSGAWSAPVNLGAPLNSAADEGYPFVTADGLELWYSGSSRDGGYLGYHALFRSRRAGWNAVDGVWAWGAPEEIVVRYAGEPTLDAAGNVYFTHHLWDVAASALAEADIYVARRR